MIVGNAWPRPRPALTVATALIVLAASATIALAALSTSSGTTQEAMLNRGNDVAITTNMTAWQTIPDSISAPVVVPAGQQRLVNARFTAASSCEGPQGQFCRVRIVAVDGFGALTELPPVNGALFHFDSAADVDGKEAHAMERSRRFGAGTYTFSVQYSVSNNNTLFTLTHRHESLEVSL